MGLNFESIFHLRQRMAFKSIYDEATRRFDTIGKWAYFAPMEGSGVQHCARDIPRGPFPTYEYDQDHSHEL